MELDREDIEQFLVEARDSLDESEPLLISLIDSWESNQNLDKEKIDQIFRTFHSIKGVAGFLSFTSIQNTTHSIETVLDEIRRNIITPNPTILKSIFNSCDFIRKLLNRVDEANEDTGFEDEAEKIQLEIKQFKQNKDSENSKEIAFSESENTLAYPFLMDEENQVKFREHALENCSRIEEVLVTYLDAPSTPSLLSNACPLFTTLGFNAQVFGHEQVNGCATSIVNILEKTSELTHVPADYLPQFFELLSIIKELINDEQQNLPRFNEIISGFNDSLQSRNNEKPKKANSPGKPAGKKEQASESKKKEMRVDVEKLDKLIALIEDLGFARNFALIQKQNSDSENDLCLGALAQLDKVTSSLQDVAISIRMVPLQATFNRMIRLVHDVSGKLGKKVSFEITGGVTEIDRNDIEAVQDPLVHIIRNAIDHGLESPEDRIESGKNEQGNLSLSAWHSGGEVIIAVNDDGKGIDPKRILDKAIKSGILSGPAPEMTNEEIYQLLFAPGFSTADGITSISGRGVGMDVVKRNIENLGGKIEIESTLGKGSTFTIRIPVNNSLIDTLLLRVGDYKYIIRIASVKESFKPKREDITVTYEGEEYVTLRGQQYPVVRVHKIHNISGCKKNLWDGILVLVETKGDCFSLFVDEIIGKQQSMVKPLPKYVQNARALSGFTIAGNSWEDIGWAIDISCLLSLNNCLLHNQ